MTSLDRDSFCVNSIGNQAQSARLTAPSYSLSKCSRASQECTFISKDHIRTQKLGRESDVMYTPRSTLDLEHGIRFVKGKRPDFHKLAMRGAEEPGDMPSGDLMGTLPDSQPFKYPRSSEIIIGTYPRGKMKEATLLKSHSAAFYGRQSPGPAAIGTDYGPEWKSTKPREAPARPFGKNFANGSMFHVINANPDIGPGSYPRRDVAIGKQHLTHRKNQSVNEFSHSAKFPKVRSADAISKLDAARSSLGKQVLHRNRSEPSINFNADSRDIRAKTALCMTRADMGPKVNMPKFHMSMPSLPPERMVMTSGFG